MTTVCSWCSASVAEGATECPSCGANLMTEGGEPIVPGVTAVDAAAIIRSRPAPKPRGGLLSWISGESAADAPGAADAKAVAPPDLDVRREILRLELEAEVANLQAEADALWAEAAAEGRPIETANAENAQRDPTAEAPAAAAADEPADTEDRPGS